MSRIETVIKNAELIKNLINKYKIFSSDISVEVKKLDENMPTIVLYFSLDKENYSNVIYLINTGNGSLEGKVLGVYSNVGNKIGSFLLQLHLLLMFISNVTYLNLDNYTDEPARAARGVYSDFDVKKRAPVEQWVGKDLAAQLLMSEGEMVYKPSGDSRKIIETKIREIVAEQKEKSEIKGEALPFWNNFDNIDKFLRDLKQYNGGGVRKSKLRTRTHIRKNKNINKNKIRTRKRINKNKNKYKNKLR